MEVLNVLEQPLVDNSIVSWEYHNYQPYINSSFEYNDELTIPIQELDAYILPCESMLYLEGKLTKDNDEPATKLKLINNAFAFLFRELRYELNGVLVDSVRNVGLTSTLKSYLSYNADESIALENAGWYPRSTSLGYCKCNDIDAVIAVDDSEKPKIHIEWIYLRMHHITVAIPQQLAVSNFIQILDKNKEILMSFRSWELIELPSIVENTKHMWPVKTTTKMETPRHVVIALQTGKKRKHKRKHV
ncbi:hypothetical protein NQ315_011282 [Exocentrus adspersus]|uniref:Double jelly roll-like domain-containing protein n=1 Tax=Exocentrus adspersus TaxID=1586481 RepID=A0AAV8VIX2_9CUCU|nr:hypothetical protein NQ315_011282 [Exocentrus adspersus]